MEMIMPDFDPKVLQNMGSTTKEHKKFYAIFRAIKYTESLLFNRQEHTFNDMSTLANSCDSCPELQRDVQIINAALQEYRARKTLEDKLFKHWQLYCVQPELKG